MVRPIGQGATGTVWRGEDRSTGEPVAIKLLHDSLLRQPRLVTRFVQERTILLMLRHRNVVRVRDLFSAGETLGLVMDLVAGGSLRDHLHRHGPMPPARAIRLAAQVASALAEAHELGIIHRDLKPDNILLRSEGAELETRLTDFGIARILTLPSMTTPNAVVGTPHYMAPEAFHGTTPSAATDVYALGVLLYELVAGEPPYRSDAIGEIMRLHFEGRPERRPGIPDPLWKIIARCLSGKPRLRPSAAELVTELTALGADLRKLRALPRSAAAGDPVLDSDASNPDTRAPGGPDAPDVLDPAALDPAALDPAALDPAALDPAALDPAALDPAPKSDSDQARGSGRPPGSGSSRHGVPSIDSRAPLRRRRWLRHNAAPARWARPGATAALVAGTMLASGVATTAWHMDRADGNEPAGVPAVITAPSAAPLTVTPRRAASQSPSTRTTTTRPARIRKAATGVAHSAPRKSADVRVTRPHSTRTAVRQHHPEGRADGRWQHHPEGRADGRWQCTPKLVFDVRTRSPLSPRPCHQIGRAIRFQASLTAPSGGRGRIEVSLRDTRTGRTVAGPATCDDLTFTRRSMTQDCGPTGAAPRRGGTYAVVMSYRYIRNGRLASNTAAGRPFTW